MPTPRTDPFLDSVAFRERIMEYRHLADDRRVELLLLCAMLHRLGVLLGWALGSLQSAAATRRAEDLQPRRRRERRSIMETIPERLRQDYHELKLRRANPPRPHTVNHAHSAGHPCDRYLVLLRTAWRLQLSLTDPIKAALFQEGHHQERALVSDLRDLDGWRVVQQARPIFLPKLELSGQIDFLIGRKDGPLYVADAKSVSPGLFRSLDTVEDVRRAKPWYVRQWEAQLLLYLEGLREELVRNPIPADYADVYVLDRAFLLLKDKLTGDLKVLTIPYEVEVFDRVSHRLQATNLVARGIRKALGPDLADRPGEVEALRPLLPRPLADPRVCPTCPFFHVCSPDMEIHPAHCAVVIEEPDLLEILEAREKLVDLDHRFTELNLDAKALLENIKVPLGPDGKGFLGIGPFLVTVTEVRPKSRPPFRRYDIWRAPTSEKG